MSEDNYSLEGMLAELVDDIIPGPAPGSIVKTYLHEALLQSGGHALLGTFRGPRTGHTVGTALIGRGHGLYPTYLVGPVSGSQPSLLWWLLERGVRLDMPDAHGNTALIKGLTGPFGGPATGWFKPNGLFNKANFNEVFSCGSVHCPSLPVYSVLAMDPSGMGLASVSFAPSVFSWVASSMMEALKAPSRNAQENARWVQAALLTCHASFEPLLIRAVARWQALAFESSLPSGPPKGALPPLRF